MARNTSKLLFQKQAEILQAVAHPLRIAILDFLRDGEQCVCDIAEHVGSERSNVSRHLSVMVKAGVLQCSKQGLKVIYEIKTPCIVRCLSYITDCLKQQAAENSRLLKGL